VIDAARERSLATEAYRVTAWRIEQLIRSGYPPTNALILAIDRDVDLEVAGRLVRRGCPPSLAVRILS
jgi:hypothetical protein